jgi:hypothetical protein
MDIGHQLQGIELRYALTMYLLQHGPTTVNGLIEAMTWQGFDIGGRASKKVSDALRWETDMYRALRSTAFTSACSHCVPLPSRCGSEATGCRSALSLATRAN